MQALSSPRWLRMQGMGGAWSNAGHRRGPLWARNLKPSHLECQPPSPGLSKSCPSLKTQPQFPQLHKSLEPQLRVIFPFHSKTHLPKKHIFVKHVLQGRLCTMVIRQSLERDIQPVILAALTRTMPLTDLPSCIWPNTMASSPSSA